MADWTLNLFANWGLSGLSVRASHAIRLTRFGFAISGLKDKHAYQRFGPQISAETSPYNWPCCSEVFAIWKQYAMASNWKCSLSRSSGGLHALYVVCQMFDQFTQGEKKDNSSATAEGCD